MDYNKIYINGLWIESTSNEFIDVINPSNEEVIALIPKSNKRDVDLAVEAAKNAFKTWQFVDLEERIKLISRFRENLIKYLDEMNELIVMELGSGYKPARNVHLLSYIEEIDELIEIARNYDYLKKEDGYLLVREPVGVVAALTPWNYPFGQIIKKIVPALLAGNTVVLKPSQTAPLISYYITKALEEAGLPKGVFNLVTGVGSEVGELISKHQDIDLVSFTGSTTGGKIVGKNALESVKNITLELGGKSPSLVLEGADLNLAVRKTLNSIFYNTGQTCSALSRLIVPRLYKEEIESLILDRVKTYKFGNPILDKEVLIGPLVSKSQYNKVIKHIEDGVKEGAKLLVDGIPKEKNKGYFIGPTVFTDVKNNMSIAQEEIFGPVLVIIYYDCLDQGIKIANDSPYGLSGAIFGPEELAIEVSRVIRTGNILINQGSSTNSAPFGGYKQSGIGREGGLLGFEEFLEVKAIFI